MEIKSRDVSKDWNQPHYNDGAKMRFTKLTGFSILILTVLLTGCVGGPTINMNAADKANIKSVSMNAPPLLPSEIFLHGRTESLSAIGGAIGAALVASADKEPKSKIIDAMKANGIDLPSILTSEFSSASASRGLLTRTDSAAITQGNLTLVINLYGFGQTQGFSALLYPTLSVTATIKKPNGEIAWQRTEFATPHNSENKYGYEFEQYLKEPELLRKALTNISGIVSKMLIDAYSAGG